MLDRTNAYQSERRSFVLPENIEAEQALLGALLTSNDAMSALPQKFAPSHFSSTHHAEIFAAIKSAHAQGKSINPVTLKSFLSPDFMGQTIGDMKMSAYVAKLYSSAVSIINVPDFCDAIISTHQRREAMIAAEQIELAVSSCKDEGEFAAQIGAIKTRFDALLKSSTASKKSLSFIKWQDIKHHAPKLEWIVQGLLTARDRSLIVGAPGSAKTFLAMEIAMCIARGKDFLGREVMQGAVLYQAKEGSSGFANRVEAYRVHNNIPEDAELPFYYLPEKIDLFAKDGDTQRLIDEINELRKSVPDIRILFVDTFNRAAGEASEIDGADIRQIISHIERIQTECQIHVCVIHHVSAGGRTRGHTSLEGDFEQRLLVEKDERSRIRTVKIDKLKEGQDKIVIPFALTQVRIGFDEKTQSDITSCAVVDMPERERLQVELEVQGYSPGKAERSFLLNFFEAERLYGKPCVGQDGLPQEAYGKTVVDISDYLDVAVASKAAVGEDQKEVAKAKDAARKWWDNNPSLRQYGIIHFKKPYMWWTGRPIRGFANTFPKNNPDAPENNPPPPYTGPDEDLDVGF